MDARLDEWTNELMKGIFEMNEGMNDSWLLNECIDERSNVAWKR